MKLDWKKPLSEWSDAELLEAVEFCKRFGWRKREARIAVEWARRRDEGR